MSTDKYILKIYTNISCCYYGFSKLKYLENFLNDILNGEFELYDRDCYPDFTINDIENIEIYNCKLRHRSNYFKRNHKQFIKEVLYCGGGSIK